MSKLKEIASIMGGVILTFSVMVLLFWATARIISYWVSGDGGGWKIVMAGFVWISFGTFWVYMRTHSWHD
jgi:hypothetical protein